MKGAYFDTKKGKVMPYRNQNSFNPGEAAMPATYDEDGGSCVNQNICSELPNVGMINSINKLAEQLGELSENVARLEGKLEPILNKNEQRVVSKDPEDSVSKSQMAELIDNNTQDVESINYRITQLLGRIDF